MVNRKSAAVIAIIAILAWPFDHIVPGAGGEWSWFTGFVTAGALGPPHGAEFIWNYGPLGVYSFDTVALLFFGKTMLSAYIYQWAVQVLLVGTVYLAAKRWYHPAWAGALAFIVAVCVPQRTFVLAFAWCALALIRVAEASPAPAAAQGRQSPMARDAVSRWFPAALGVLGGILILGKLNLAVVFIGLATVTLITRADRRPVDAASCTGALLGVAALGWFVGGQNLGGIWPYLRYGYEIIRGYPSGAGAGYPGGEWQYLVAATLFVLAGALAWRYAATLPPRQRWGLLVLWVVYFSSQFKAAFVRHDDPHALLFFGGALIAFAILPVPSLKRWRAVAGTGIAVGAASFAAVSSAPTAQWLNPMQNATSAVMQPAKLASPEWRETSRKRHAALVRDEHALPVGLVNEIGDHSVAFWPYSRGDLAYAWALNWRPTPLMEPYTTTTPAIDELVAEMLSSTRAPERVVRTPLPIHEVFDPSDPPRFAALNVPPLEPPLTSRALFCSYGEIARVAPAWQLLAPTENRCAGPREVVQVSSHWGETVDVPTARPGTALLMQISGLEPSGIERLKAFWLRPDPRIALLDNGAYRVLPELAESGYLIAIAPDVDYAPPLEAAPNPQTVTIERIGTRPEGTLEFTFLEMPIT